MIYPFEMYMGLRYCTVLAYSCMNRLACTVNLHASDYPPTSKYLRVPTHIRVEKSTSKSCVLSLDYIMICYLCHVKVPNLHKYFKPCLLC